MWYSWLKEFWVENKSVIKYIFWLFIITRLVLTIVGVLSKTYFYHKNPNVFKWSYSQNYVLDIWGIWDSGYYLDIAKRGYQLDQNYEFSVQIPKNAEGGSENNHGFLPFYPILVRALSYLTNDFYKSALIISNLSFLVSGYLLYKLVCFFYDQKVAKSTLVYLFIFPSSFIYSGVFVESLALLLILSSFYLATKNRFVESALMVSLASITKLIGLTAFFAFMIKVMTRPLTLKKLTILALPLTFLGVFCLYQYIKTGNPFIYFTTQKAGWGAGLSNPIENVLILALVNNVPIEVFTIKTITLMFIIFEIYLLRKSFKIIPIQLWAFWCSAFLVSISSGVAQTLSYPRHSLLLFPHYIALTLLISKKLHWAIISLLMITLQILFMALWVSGRSII